ncbi:MAG: DUF3793 family protein [Synergistaceae bacterium]|jgi:hypothetical protein|nr:DUF3793 family protein [Synergistaceae bacterium]
MPILQELMFFLKTQDEKTFIESMITCFAAPVLRGIKCGALINLSRGGEDLRTAWYAMKGYLSQKLRLEFAEIKTSRKSVILFIYRRELLASRLSERDSAAFLKRLGYDCSNNCPFGCIENLVMRFEWEMPHEVGIFLGYPLEDVEGFIKNRGRREKISGYWKVYGNEKYALEKFGEYKNAETNAALKMLEGSAAVR